MKLFGLVSIALLVCVIALFMFVLGVATAKYKFFPLAQLNRLSRTALHIVGTGGIDPKEVARQYSRDTETIALERKIDTGLLPLKINGIRLGESYPVPKVAGGITSIGNTVLVLDRLGNIYSCSPAGDVTKLSFPPLPNNMAEYLRSGGPLDTKSLRAYSIKYLGDSGLIVVSHELFDPQQDATRMAVSVIGFDSGSMKSVGAWKTIFSGDLEPGGSNDASGGRLAVAGRDKILLAMGVYKLNGDNSAQELNSTFGKILEITVSTQNVKMLSRGHRNPQGLVVTKAGQIFSTEHGPLGGDELNLITEGANYAWPVVTLGVDYNTYGWEHEHPAGKHAGYQLPVFAWVPSIAVSNLIQVGGFSDRWDGDLLVASLKDQSLFRLRLDGDRVLYSEPIWLGQRIRDIAQLSNSTIALWTDDAQLLFMSVDNERLSSNKRLPESIGDTLVYSCMYCHHLGPTSAADVAPSLSDIFERSIASDNFRYSAALRSKEGTWNEDSVRAFLSNPGQFASGTAMPSPNLTSDGIDEVIRALKQLSDHTN